MKNNHLVVSLFAMLMLSGCGTNVPDCADASVLEVVKELSTGFYRSNLKQSVKQQYGSFMGVPMSQIRGQASLFMGMMSGTIQEKHFDVTPNEVKLIRADKYDKDLPKRECSATVTFNAKLAEFPKGSDDYKIVNNVIGRLPSNLNKEIEITYSISPDLSQKGSNVIEVKLKK